MEFGTPQNHVLWLGIYPVSGKLLSSLKYRGHSSPLPRVAGIPSWYPLPGSGNGSNLRRVRRYLFMAGSWKGVGTLLPITRVLASNT